MAQNTPATSSQPAAAADQTVKLPEFTVSENSGNPYLSRQAISSSRVAMPIQDIPQTVSVITSDFIQDSLSARMLDAVKYVTPVVESTLPIGGDRYMIRGFQVSHEFIDGIEISGQGGYSMSIAPYNIERIEVIKGPNAILVPGGSPGGQMNPITKSPLQKDKTSVTLELAQYYGTALSTDVNRVLDEKNHMAVRVVGAYWRSEGYAMHQYRHGYMFAPSFSVQLTPSQKLVIKGEVVQSRESRLSGLPIDPAVGSDDTARRAPGLPRDWSFGDETDTRHRATERLTGELYSTFGDHVSSRLQIIGDHVMRDDVGGTNAAISNATGSRNPYTGKYEPGVTWTVNNSGATAVITSAVTPLPAPSAYNYTRGQDHVFLEYDEAHIKNEYAAKFDGSFWKSTTVAGFAGNTSKVRFKAYPSASRPPVSGSNLGGITYPAWNFVEPSAPSTGGDKTGKQNDVQLFIYENASFLDDRLSISGGVSRFSGTLSRVDNTGIAIPSPYYPSYNLTDDAESLGVVVKPIPEVSLFYGYNSTGGTMPDSLSVGTIAPNFKVAVGDQNEYGIKSSLLGGKLNLSVAYFDIVQSNYGVPNSEYYVLQAQGIPIPPDFPSTLYLDLNSKGWEFEASYAFGNNLTVVGNYTDFKIRQPITNVRVRAVPDQSGAIYADYRFTDGPLKGFGANIGVDYKADSVGENVTGYTTTRPIAGVGFVANQPTFLVASRTLVNVGVTYRREQWTARLQVNNALDEDYILAAGSRTAAVMGDPVNLKLSVTYNFK